MKCWGVERLKQALEPTGGHGFRHFPSSWLWKLPLLYSGLYQVGAGTC